MLGSSIARRRSRNHQEGRNQALAFWSQSDHPTFSRTFPQLAGNNKKMAAGSKTAAASNASETASSRRRASLGRGFPRAWEWQSAAPGGGVWQAGGRLPDASSQPALAAENDQGSPSIIALTSLRNPMMTEIWKMAGVVLALFVVVGMMAWPDESPASPVDLPGSPPGFLSN